MKKLLGIKVTNEEFDYLFCEQAKGKELKVIDGKVVAVEHQVTEEELLQQELSELVKWFEGYYRTQIEQYERCKRMGIEFDKDINELDSEAVSKQLRIREIRELLK